MNPLQIIKDAAAEVWKLTSMKRLPDETWKDYKARRKELNKLSYPSPVLVWDSGVQGTYHKPVEEKIVEASYDV